MQQNKNTVFYISALMSGCVS